MFSFGWEASRYHSKPRNSGYHSKPSNSATSSINIPSYSCKSNAESLPTPRSEAEILSSPNANHSR